MMTIKFDKNKIKKIKRVSHSKTSKKIIIFIICAIFVFTGLAIWVQLKTGVELSPTLITCFYAFCTGELWMLASIKKSKLRTGQKELEYKPVNKDKDNDNEPVG